MASSSAASTSSSFDKFIVKELLGKGSFGQVHRVVRKSDSREYALKEINMRNLTQKEREDSVNEIRILASMNHPNLIRYHESFMQDDKLFIVTEFASRGDLYNLIKKQKLKNKYISEEIIWKMFLQMLAGIRELHRKNILHRDLKTPNIFLSAGDEEIVKIGDLGVAKHLKNRSSLANTQVGTPYYVSPEIWKHQAYDAKSDMWSLGCVLYELIALRRPFEAEDVQTLVRKIFSGRLPALPGVFSKDLSELVKKLLEVNPKMRPTLDAILHMPCVTRRLHLLPLGGTELGIGQPAATPTSGKVISTIKVPRNLRQLQLPSPCYPNWAALDDLSPSSSGESPLSGLGRNLSRDFLAMGERDGIVVNQRDPGSNNNRGGPDSGSDGSGGVKFPELRRTSRARSEEPRGVRRVPSNDALRAPNNVAQQPAMARNQNPGYQVNSRRPPMPGNQGYAQNNAAGYANGVPQMNPTNPPRVASKPQSMAQEAPYAWVGNNNNNMPQQDRRPLRMMR